MKAIDYTNKRFSRLLVLERVNNTKQGRAVWKCLCDCGNITYVRSNNLQSGAVKSCGCLRHETPLNKTHGMSKSRLYQEWASIKSRCLYKSAKNDTNYGGRGISMCKEWANSFIAFKEWAEKNGYNDNLTIERINVNGDYCPKNCTWIPRAEQAKNTRSCLRITYNGKTKILSEWCKELGLDYKRTNNRIKKLGWTPQKSFETPVNKNKRNMASRKNQRR